MNGKLIVAGMALALTLGACGAQDAETAENAPAPTQQKETQVTTPETQKVAATYDLKIEGMT